MRTEGDLIKINDWLLPLSWIYGGMVRFRNWLFDIGLKKSQSFSIPIISVGNITVGGSGKTPHVEYLIRLLHDKVKIAVLSRGYKRKTSGYVLADKDTTMSEIGDEPFQMHSKFDDIYVAVDAKRVRGIEKLQNEEPTKDVDVVLLDDAFQHRYVKPGINILLVDYHRLIIYDKMLPAGRLREPLSGKNRADIVIITKCPKDLKPMEFRVLTKAMDLYPFQKLYFTCINYDTPKGVFEDQQIAKEELKNYHALLVTGIASPKQMEHDLKPMVKSMQSLSFGDHHRFKNKDITRINEAFEQMPLPVNTSDFSAACPQFIPAFSKDHQMIGLVSNRGYSCQYKKVISLANIDIRYAQEGTELYVLYGSEGHRQTMIRATVTRTPYKADRRK